MQKQNLCGSLQNFRFEKKIIIIINILCSTMLRARSLALEGHKKMERKKKRC